MWPKSWAELLDDTFNFWGIEDKIQMLCQKSVGGKKMTFSAIIFCVKAIYKLAR
jgi:hypothetical protein